MVKITSKLYRPADLVKVIEAVEKALAKSNYPDVLEGANLVIDLRKMGYKIVKVDDGE